MNRSRLLAVAATAIVAAASSVLAQGSGLRPPAELPPSSYESMQYVDSRGCAYVRAGVSGSVVWVPRVNRDRSQICGQPPTFGGGSTVTAQAPVAPTAPPPAAPPAPSVAAVEPPARPPAGAPIETVASLTTSPNVGASPAPVAAPAAGPATLTLAQVCEGRTGILPGYRTTTGAQVNCGGAPAASPVPVSAPAAAPAPLTLAQVCEGRTGPLPGYVNAATGQPVSCGPAPAAIAAAPVAPATATPAPAAQLTLAQACAGRTGPLPGYVNAATGQPVVCGPAPSLSAPVLAGAQPCPPGVIGGVAYRCGGATYADPLSSSTLSLAGVARAAEQPYALALREPVPASNPVGAPQVVEPPRGYASVWDDGRLNPDRGPVAAEPARVVTRAPAPQAVAPVQAAPAPVQPVAAPVANAGHRYVQVGTYGDASNAARAIATLQGMGLPTASATINSNGRALQVIVAGPFGDGAALQAALNAARAAGYSDAFTRG